MSATKITGIAEIVLSVRNLAVMKEFYMEVLRFRFFKEGSYPAEGISISDDEPTIIFLAIKEMDTPVGRDVHPQSLVLIDYQRHSSGRPGHHASTSILHHLAFEIPPDSYNAHLENLTSLNLDPRQVDFEELCAKSLFFKDPEGNSIELICHAPKTEIPR